MATNPQDRTLLRDLAKQVAEIAALPEQAEKARLWTACNDLRPERAMVYADPQNGWGELDAAWLPLTCTDPSLHGFEHTLRRKLLRHAHIPDDFPLFGTFDVGPHITGGGYDDYGPKLGMTRSRQPDGAYHIVPTIQSEKDLEKLHFRPIQIDSEAADRTVARAQDLFGDILEVRPRGRTFWRYGLTRVLIHMRGLDQMMLDLYDNPELIHHLMGFLRDDYMREIDLFEEAQTVSLNNTPDNVTGSGGLSPTEDLPGEDFSGVPRVKHCLCWGESQETVGVSPAQFDEFVLHYQLPLLNRFGLVDYGCCEPLNHKLDVLIRKVPHLRWVSVAPWADREMAAEKLNGHYVYVYKPNPAPLCAPQPNFEQAEQELRETLEIAQGCPVHLVMKDTHTFHHQPERITRWAQIASRVVREMAA